MINRIRTVNFKNRREFTQPISVELWGFGSNEEGQLGLNGKRVAYGPTIMHRGDINSIACGHEHTIFSLQDGTLMSSGSAKSFQSGQFQTVSQFTKIESKIKAKKVAAGKVHSLILDCTGTVFSVGNGAKGQLGYDSNDRYKPKEIESLKNKDIVDVYCGSHSSFALAGDGKLFGWGCDLFFQLGNGVGENILTPTQVTGPLKEKKVIKVASGMLHTIALTEENEVYVWGSNRYSQLGVDDIKLSPFPVPLKLKKIKEKVIDIAVGWHHNILLTENGIAYSWGDNSLGQLGISEVLKAPLTQIRIPKKIAKIGCGNNHTVIATDDSELYSFGSGTEHQLGLGEYYSTCNQKKTSSSVEEDKLNYLRNGTILYSPRIVPGWNMTSSKLKVHEIHGGDTHTIIVVSHENLN